jgi:hypothetical protein
MSDPQSNDQVAAGDRAPLSAPGLPRWVKVFLIMVVALILLGVGAALLIGGEHGPGRHRAGSVTTGAAPLPALEPNTISGLI